jgi:hypothetical protein
MSQSDALPVKAGAIAFTDRGIQLRTFEDAYRFATAIAKSGLAPKGVETPEKILVALQAGLELGFSPLRALSAVVVVNGRASLMGEAALAKIRQAQVCTFGPEVGTRGEGEKREGYAKFSRDTNAPIEVTFTMADAKRAGLWGKSGPWTQYADDMLMWRAVARSCKRYFSDVLLGLTIAEEAQDIPVTETARPEGQPLTRSPQPDPLLLDATAPAEANEGAEIPATSAGAVDEPLSPLDEKGVCKTCERHVETYGHQNGCPDAPQ